MNKGLVNHWNLSTWRIKVKACKVKSSDHKRLMVQGIALMVCLTTWGFVFYSAGAEHGRRNAEKERNDIQQSMESGENFIAFGQFNVWKANNNVDLCFSKARKSQK